MGCEMLLLESAEDELPIMLIEEPEAHLHPQRQLVVMEYLQKQALVNSIQIIVTTHSPLLTSVIKLENMVLLKNQSAFSLDPKFTALDAKDYEFLERFLDSTRANLFFAKSVLLVEGDAENILIPTLARLIDRDFTKNGVSVVNIGHTGLSRYARIFQRKTPTDEVIGIPVACLPDTDVLPESAPEILGLDISANRKWKYLGELAEGELTAKKASLAAKSDGQSVKSFPSELWTLEYDLANNGLLEEMWGAILFAQNDGNNKDSWTLLAQYISELEKLNSEDQSIEEKAVHCYSRFTNKQTDYAKGKSKVSKSIAAQYLARILIDKYQGSPNEFRELLPPYIVEAIEYVTTSPLVKNVS
jgi:putative ATP-dependent endonuclease of OLD family